MFVFEPEKECIPIRVELQWEQLRDLEQADLLFKVSHASIVLKPMRIAIEEQFLWQLVAWTSSVIPSSAPNPTQPPTGSTMQRLLIEQVMISQVQLVLSFSKNGMRGSWGHASDVMYPVANLTDVPLSFDEFFYRKTRGAALETMTEKLLGWYQNQLLQNTHLVLGSADVIGNPVQLLHSLHEAADALKPWETPNHSKGIDVGAAARHLLEGLTGLSMHLAKAAARASATFSLDSRYLSWREIDRQHFEAAKLTTEGTCAMRHMGHGIERLCHSLVDALRGLRSPTQQLMSAGPVRAVLQGCVVASLGIVAKPVAGVMDVAAGVSQDVHQAVKQINQFAKVHRVQEPASRLQELSSALSRPPALLAEDSVASISRMLLMPAADPVPPGFKVLRNGTSGDVAVLHGTSFPAREAVNLVVVYQTCVRSVDAVSAVTLIPVNHFPNPKELPHYQLQLCCDTTGDIYMLTCQWSDKPQLCWLGVLSDVSQPLLTSLILQPTGAPKLSGWQNTGCSLLQTFSPESSRTTSYPRWSSLLVRHSVFLFQHSLTNKYQLTRCDLMPITNVLLASKEEAAQLESQQGYHVLRSTVLGDNAGLLTAQYGGAAQYVCYSRSTDEPAISGLHCVLEERARNTLGLSFVRGGLMTLVDLQVVKTSAASYEVQSHGYKLLRLTDDGRAANLCDSKRRDAKDGMFLGMLFRVL